MVHLWLRSESRANEQRAALTPQGARRLIARGFRITVEDSPQRVLGTADYAAAGAAIAAPGSWPAAPADAVILGVKELPPGGPLIHRHILFGHAFRGQPGGPALLRRFRDGGGRLLDLEYLTDDSGRRLAAFGHWAGFAGAAVALKAWAAQRRGDLCGAVAAWPSQERLTAELRAELDATGSPRPRAPVVGALGRVGRGALALLDAMGVEATRWDMAETAGGGPFPQILAHEILVNCILAGPDTPVLVAADAVGPGRRLTVIGDVSCDPASPFNPVRVYDRVTDWAHPVLRLAEAPPLDVMAIDNLPSLLPRDSTLDFAGQLLPLLGDLDRDGPGRWARAEAVFATHLARLS